MYNHILIPTDGSPLSIVAMEKSIDFARETGAKVTVITIAEPFHVISSDADQISKMRADHERLGRERAADYLTVAELKAKALGVPCETLQVENDQPYQAIIDAAVQRGCDLIAMASHGRRGLDAIILGSQTLKVLTHSKVPVLVYR
ncbi:universal stress protein [Methylocella tundrae]|uniref:universal stress protein n=1 Tax=Methylocella tundrae TaxID=227605 RepID=UPI0030FEC3E3|nr:universal stress protein [Methylocella tundrae]